MCFLVGLTSEKYKFLRLIEFLHTIQKSQKNQSTLTLNEK
jgi:hypothetical protein